MKLFDYLYTYTRAHTQIYIYIYMYICVCTRGLRSFVCVCEWIHGRRLPASGSWAIPVHLVLQVTREGGNHTVTVVLTWCTGEAGQGCNSVATVAHLSLSSCASKPAASVQSGGMLGMPGARRSHSDPARRTSYFPRLSSCIHV